MNLIIQAVVFCRWNISQSNLILGCCDTLSHCVCQIRHSDHSLYSKGKVRILQFSIHVNGTLTWKNHLEKHNTNLFGHISTWSVMVRSWGEWLPDCLSLHKCQRRSQTPTMCQPESGLLPVCPPLHNFQGCCSSDTHIIKACIITGRPRDSTHTHRIV